MESKMNTVSTEENTKPVYQVKKSWLGISDWIVDKVGVRPATWNFILKVFRMIVRGSKHMEAPVFGPIYKRLMKFTPEEKTYSHGTVLNLNVDVSDKGESKVLPIDLVKDMLRHGCGHVPQRPEFFCFSRGFFGSGMRIDAEDHFAFLLLEQERRQIDQQDGPGEILRQEKEIDYWQNVQQGHHGTGIRAS